MGVGLQDVGHSLNLQNRAKKFLTTAAVIAAMSVGLLATGTGKTVAGGETRTLSIYHTHTKERLTVTYMVNGKYVPSAMKKINYILRDWRRNEVITIDPKTINLMWELHADLGSKAPIGIVSGYRSPRTNAFLKRIGRNVARKSQHMKGKAIDIFFPDVNTKTMRNSALVRKVGGVGYYRSAGGPTGFLHIDSGNVRHWGPAISNREMASIFSKYKRTVGARLSGADRVMVATRESEKSKAIDETPSIYDGTGNEEDDEGSAQLASLSAKAGKASEQEAASQPVLSDSTADEQVVAAAPQSSVPRPRSKPIEVLMMAAANMQIEPASAPPPTRVSRPRPLVQGVALATIDPSIDDAITDSDQSANPDGKGSFAEVLKPKNARLKPVLASAGEDINWWPQQTDTAKPLNTIELPPVDGQPLQQEEAVIEETPADGKTDMLVIDRSGKGNLPAPLPSLIKG